MSNAHRTSAWTKARNIAKPRVQAIIDSGNGYCFDGRHVIQPGDASWDVSHIISVATMQAAGIPEHEWHEQENLTSSCRKHNRSAGGRVGAKISNHTKATTSGRIDEW